MVCKRRKNTVAARLLKRGQIVALLPFVWVPNTPEIASGFTKRSIV